MRAYPVTAPEQGAGVMDAEGHELAWFDRLDQVAEPLQALLREAIAAWFTRRYGLTRLDPAMQILPVNGTREALFAFAQCVVDGSKPDPLVACPNPFYQIYEGAALLAGAEGRYMRGLKSLLGTRLMRERRVLLGESLDFIDIVARFLERVKTHWVFFNRMVSQVIFISLWRPMRKPAFLHFAFHSAKHPFLEV